VPYILNIISKSLRASLAESMAFKHAYRILLLHLTVREYLGSRRIVWKIYRRETYPGDVNGLMRCPGGFSGNGDQPGDSVSIRNN
jgi:hypothetical protein